MNQHNFFLSEGHYSTCSVCLELFICLYLVFLCLPFCGYLVNNIICRLWLCVWEDFKGIEEYIRYWNRERQWYGKKIGE